VTREQLKDKYPNASESFLRANCPDAGGEASGAKLERPARHEPKPMTITPTTDEAKLNKTERTYLAYLRGTNSGAWIGVQNITLKLADDTRFTPDFSVVNHDGEMRLIDVKGFQREDALIKIKVAARLFPFCRFVIVKRDGSGWNHQDVKP
jgi:hypothetical protein